MKPSDRMGDERQRSEASRSLLRGGAVGILLIVAATGALAAAGALVALLVSALL